MQIIEKLATCLLVCHQTLSVAESCTGGQLSANVTYISGSSRWYKGGVIAYSNEVKENLLGVPHQMLELYGAVSNEVATAMAEGVRKRLHTDIALATTGIAGPTGGTDEKPVGTVWIACSTPYFTQTKLLLCTGNRNEIQQEAVSGVLRLALDILSSSIQ